MKPEEEIRAQFSEQKLRPADWVRRNTELGIPFGADVITIDESGLCARFFICPSPFLVRGVPGIEPCVLP